MTLLEVAGVAERASGGRSVSIWPGKLDRISDGLYASRSPIIRVPTT